MANLDWDKIVVFNDGSKKRFQGFWKTCIQEIGDYCKSNGLSTVCMEDPDDESVAENPDTVYTSIGHEPLPEPSALECRKSVIRISATVHEENGEWLDWWIDCDDPGIILPVDEREVERYLRKFEIILVGDKWFAGHDADKAINECYRQYRKITVLDDKEHVVAEIYDTTTIQEPSEDLGRYRWMSMTTGQVLRNFEEVLEHAEDGETFRHNYKGW